MKMLRIFQIGAGRIGAIHAASVAASPLATLYGIADINQAAAEALASQYGSKTLDIEAGLADKNVDTVVQFLISTNTHADPHHQSGTGGEGHFLHEKPVDLDIARVQECLNIVADCKVPLFLGFNRRFDPSFRALHDALRGGRVGKLEMVTITSRDPAPPPAEYAKVSGGIFRDMMIHDLDIAQWLLPGEKITQVFASGSCLVDPAIGAVGDIDTALVILKTASGLLCQISNSRRACTGYDQRIEAFGEKGMLLAENKDADIASPLPIKPA